MKIVLIRHGKPTSAENPVLSASEYTKWIRRYNFSDVSSQSRPGSINKALRGYYLVSSDFNRAIHSTEIYTGRAPDLISPIYKEMEIPRYKLPFKLKAMTWVYLCRVLWMFGLKGPFESYRLAKQRSELATSELIALAKDKGTVVLFGHGYMNLHIRRVLIKRGWSLNCKSNDYWGISSLEIER
jgi:broad specificity phosphatase PhoE